MQLKDNIRESQAFLTRTIVAGMLVLATMLLLISRMVQLQVVDGEMPLRMDGPRILLSRPGFEVQVQAAQPIAGR